MLSPVWLGNPMDPTTHQAPLSMGFPRQEYRSGLLFPSPGDLPNPGIEPVSLVYPALPVNFLPTVPSGKSSRTARLKKKSNNTKCWWECGGSETVTHHRWKSEMAQALRKTVLTVFIKLNIHLLCDPAVPLWGIDSREMKVYLHTKTYTNAYSSSIHEHQISEMTQIFFSGWMDK